MKSHLFGWLVVFLAVVAQFLFEVTFGRIFVAPAILVPVLVYLSLSDSDFWSVEGAFWSGFVIDLLLHQPLGVSSISMLAGIALAERFLKVATGILEMTFVIKALLASLLSDLFFIFLAARPIGSGFSFETFLIFPRILISLLLFLSFPLLTGKKSRYPA